MASSLSLPLCPLMTTLPQRKGCLVQGHTMSLWQKPVGDKGFPWSVPGLHPLCITALGAALQISHSPQYNKVLLHGSGFLGFFTMSLSETQDCFAF